MHQVSPLRIKQLPETSMPEARHCLPAAVYGTHGVLQVSEIRDCLHDVKGVEGREGADRDRVVEISRKECHRIGIHTGNAIVGNIGAPGRVNYTLVGDSVNIAARLEQLCKEIGADSDAKILISGATAMLATDKSGFVHHGKHDVRGRTESIDVWSLG